MYVTAQRVEDTKDRKKQGINSFLYSHGPQSWTGAPPAGVLPDADPGELVASDIHLPPPGNLVRSYLDVVAPDGTPIQAISDAVAALPDPEAVPITWTAGPIWCQFAVDAAMAGEWRGEIRILLDRIVALHGRKRPA
ncbi:MAG: hypothetical protein AAB215_07865 [Planctomycetota bacterium]